MSPRFFTLPFEEVRKRNCYLAARSCIKALSQNTFSFDLIHAHVLYNGFIGAKLKNRHNKPLIVTAHGGDVYDLPFRDNWHRTIVRYVLSEADEVITVSEFNASKLLSLGLSSNKLHVIPNGYNPNLFKPLSSFSARQKTGLPSNKKVILSVGNLVDVKGHIYLIYAMKTILKKRNDVILVIVGSGPLKEKLQKIVFQLGLSGKILFVGRKMHEQIPIWLNASDIFVLPSLSEGFPTVIPEAFACGKPIIATRVGGVPEAVTNDDVGLLVDPKDSSALASAILYALERNWRKELILSHSRTYSWSNLVQEILAVYEHAIINLKS
jgi:glycosyltransferase involved in cell wall biosynthesis